MNSWTILFVLDWSQGESQHRIIYYTEIVPAQVVFFFCIPRWIPGWRKSITWSGAVSPCFDPTASSLPLYPVLLCTCVQFVQWELHPNFVRKLKKKEKTISKGSFIQGLMTLKWDLEWSIQILLLLSELLQLKKKKHEDWK